MSGPPCRDDLRFDLDKPEGGEKRSFVSSYWGRSTSHPGHLPQVEKGVRSEHLAGQTPTQQSEPNLGGLTGSGPVLTHLLQTLHGLTAAQSWILGLQQKGDVAQLPPLP